MRETIMYNPLVFLNYTFDLSNTEFSLTTNPLIVRNWSNPSVLVVDKKIHQKVFSNETYFEETGFLHANFTKTRRNNSHNVLGIVLTQPFINDVFDIILFSRTKIVHALTYSFRYSKLI